MIRKQKNYKIPVAFATCVLNREYVINHKMDVLSKPCHGVCQNCEFMWFEISIILTTLQENERLVQTRYNTTDKVKIANL